MPFLGLMREKTHRRIIDKINRNHEEALLVLRSRNSNLLTKNDELVEFRNTITRRAAFEREKIAIEVENIERLEREVAARLSTAKVNMSELASFAKSLLNLTNGLACRASDKET